MPEDPLAAAEVAGHPRSVLATAEQRVAARLDSIVPLLTPGGPTRAEGYLRTLSAKIGSVIDGEDPRPISEWLARSPLYEPLMEELGIALIEAGADDDRCAPAALAALRAWAALRAPLVGRSAPTEEPLEDLRSRMKGPDAFELLIEVAHDFRSPLTSILFLAEALRDGHSGPVTDLQRSQLGLVYSAAFGLAAIASDVMDLAREEKDLIGDEPETFPLHEVFDRVQRMVQPIVEEKGIELRVAVPDRWQGRGHPHAISRVLLNLTTNALKFTDEGSVELGVRPLPHGRLEFFVHDTGRGITPEQWRDLFKPFRRRSSNPEEGHYFSGSGVGLSIARRLLRAMGSDLRLDPENTRGTHLSFVLASSGRP